MNQIFKNKILKTEPKNTISSASYKYIEKINEKIEYADLKRTYLTIQSPKSVYFYDIRYKEK